MEKHSSASDMVENLGPILEDDCDDFVSAAQALITDLPALNNVVVDVKRYVLCIVRQ